MPRVSFLRVYFYTMPRVETHRDAKHRVSTGWPAFRRDVSRLFLASLSGFYTISFISLKELSCPIFFMLASI
ncbi:MAG TPA: hypothetical protein EYP59_10910 [Thiotrichaceae bacterium]|nr:hypothetical protein [Thiotrichaceae bacterium]